MKISELSKADLPQVWGLSKAQIETEIELFTSTEQQIEKVVREAGFRDLKQFLRAKRNLIARLTGQRPVKYRRRTPEDQEQILKLCREGKRTKEIAQELGLAPNTVSNVKKVLRDRGKMS